MGMFRYLAVPANIRSAPPGTAPTGVKEGDFIQFGERPTWGPFRLSGGEPLLVETLEG